MKIRPIFLLVPVILVYSCSSSRKASTTKTPVKAGATAGPLRSTVVIKKAQPEVVINTGKTKPEQLVAFAKLQLGVPYRYGSMDKKKGFDCSGFINYVFGHFKIWVPRTTYSFTNAGVNIPIEYSKPGDIILFTGSDEASGIVGHMGIITENDHGYIQFIHASTSRGVIISDLNSYFVPRYVKVNRVFIP